MWVIIISVFMIGLTVGFHTLGAVLWLGFLRRKFETHKQNFESLHLFRGVLTTAIALILLHIIEVFMWAALYMKLPSQAGIKDIHDAVYFSMITLTTIGYGDITLSNHWRLLAGVEGMVGIVVFGMTTATLIAVIQRSWKLHVKTGAIS